MRKAFVAAVVVGLALCLAVVAGSKQQDTNAVQYMNLGGRSDELPYSHAVLAGDTLYVAGTIGVDPETGLAPQDVEEEARLCMDGIKAKLALADMTMDEVVQIQVFCPDLSLYDQFNAVYRTYFEEHFPARAFVGSGPLLRNGRFEINAIAVRQR